MNRRKYEKQLREFREYWSREENQPGRPPKFPGVRPKDYRKIMIIHSHTKEGYGICPRCSSMIEPDYVVFCSNCGQRVFWPLEIRCHIK